MTLNFCDAGGYLVSGTEELPNDPSEYQTELRRPAIGCTRITCGRCGCSVRSHPALYPLATDVGRDWAAIYETDDWSTLPDMERDPKYRLYVCRCLHEAVRGGHPLVRDDQSMSPWTCAGHPPATFPLRVDGIEIARVTDLERVVRECLDVPGNLLFDLYERLAGTPAEGEIRALALRLLSDSNSNGRACALGLLHTHADARAAQRVLELARGDRAGFANTPDSVPLRGMDLEGRLIFTLGALWTSHLLADADVVELMRREAFRRPTTRAALPALLQRDREWVCAHADEIVVAAPNALGILLVNLYRPFGQTFDPCGLARRAVGLSDEELVMVRTQIEIHIASPMRETLLAILASGAR